MRSNTFAMPAYKATNTIKKANPPKTIKKIAKIAPSASPILYSSLIVKSKIRKKTQTLRQLKTYKPKINHHYSFLILPGNTTIIHSITDPICQKFSDVFIHFFFSVFLTLQHRSTAFKLNSSFNQLFTSTKTVIMPQIIRIIATIVITINIMPVSMYYSSSFESFQLSKIDSISSFENSSYSYSEFT